jgi:hypothetical protein
MPYGQGQMLGAGVDPRMFVQDYSGFTRAAEIQAQGMQNLGATIGQGIKDFGEARQERKKIDAEIKATSAGIESAIKMGKDLGIDIGSYLSPIQAKINDPNTSPAEALALGRTAAQGISNAFTLGIGAQERSIASQRARDENAFKLANLEVAQQRANIYGQKAQSEAAKRTEGEISILDPDTGKERKERVWKDQFGNSYDYDTKRPILNTEKYFYGEEGGLGELPPTSQVGGISDSIAQTAKMNIGRLSTAKTPGTQGGGLGCADAVCKIYNQATGEELVKGGTLSTSKMIESLSSDPRFQSVPVSQAQAGDIIVTPRGKKAGHTGIFVSDNEIASNSSKGFNGGKPGAFEQNYSKGSWMNSVATRNPGSTQVFRRVGDDGSQQAMGTPEQQAEVGRMIEQSAGMRTAQAAPSGAMPTEPRINQQPQPAPRRMVRGIPVGDGQQQKTVKIVSGEEAQRFGLKPEGTYELSFNPTGELAGVQTVSQPPTETEKAKAEEARVAKEKASASKNIAINTISEFIDDKGVATDALKSAVGYGEAFATGVAEYAPFLGTQSGKTRSDQQRLNRLIEGSILEAASLLKPVSNTDLLMLIKNRPKTTDPEETWTTYLGEIRSILADPNNYLDSGTTPTGPSSQAEDDASFIQGFQSGE